MRKAVVYTLLITAYIVLLLINRSFSRHFDGTPPNYNRRLGFNNHHVPLNFDPLITKIERVTEEITSGDPSVEIELEDYEDETPFFEEGRLNVTLRIMILFPLLDMDNDGFIDNEEMGAWLRKQAMERLDRNTRRELKAHDVDRDGFISFSECFPYFSQEEIERNDKSRGEAGWWLEQFTNADADRNGVLSFYEFRDFLNPEDSMNEKVQTQFLAEKVRQMDSDHDGKLNLVEFQTTAYVTYRYYMEYETRGAAVPSSTHVFNMLDNNQDELLDVEELRTIFDYICPGDLSYAKQYAVFLINAADDDRDGRLTLEEIFNNDKSSTIQFTTETDMQIMEKTTMSFEVQQSLHVVNKFNCVNKYQRSITVCRESLFKFSFAICTMVSLYSNFWLE